MLHRIMLHCCSTAALHSYTPVGHLGIASCLLTVLGEESFYLHHGDVCCCWPQAGPLGLHTWTSRTAHVGATAPSLHSTHNNAVRTEPWHHVTHAPSPGCIHLMPLCMISMHDETCQDQAREAMKIRSYTAGMQHTAQFRCTQPSPRHQQVPECTTTHIFQRSVPPHLGWCLP